MIILLKDLEEDCLDAVITTVTSTEEDVKKAIEKARKEKSYDWQFDNLLKALPCDCKIHTKWSNRYGTVYY